MRSLSIVATLGLLAAPGLADAHARLVKGAFAKPGRVELRFSETLIPQFSTADLTMAAMPGMAVGKIASAATVASDGRTLIVTAKAPLAAGRYSVAWRVVSADTHHVSGTYVFAVK